MSATKTRLQKQKSYEARIAKSRSNLRNLRKQANSAPIIEPNTILEKYFK